MKKIVGVRFKRLGKIYFFDPKWLEVQKGEYIIVETTQGEDIAEVIIPGRMIDEEKLNTPLKKVLRLASSKDLKHAEDLKKKEKDSSTYARRSSPRSPSRYRHWPWCPSPCSRRRRTQQSKVGINCWIYIFTFHLSMKLR